MAWQERRRDDGYNTRSTEGEPLGIMRSFGSLEPVVIADATWIVLQVPTAVSNATEVVERTSYPAVGCIT